MVGETSLKNTLFTIALALGAVQSAQALDIHGAMQSYMEQNIATWAKDPALIEAVKAQNAITAGYDASSISKLDALWAAEIGASDTTLIASVTQTPASESLRARIAKSGGAVFEIFVMDAKGLNVASSGVTSDYWQADEAKFQQSYGLGAGAVHYGDVEYDKSGQQYQAQISVTLVDPASGAPIGAMTVGVNPDALM